MCPSFNLPTGNPNIIPNQNKKFIVNHTNLTNTANMATFESAITDSKKLLAKPSNDELLELYGIPPSRFFFLAKNMANLCSTLQSRKRRRY